MYQAALSGFLLLLFGCASVSPAPETNPPIPLVGGFQAYRFHLDNGLKLIVVPDATSPTFAFQTWYGVGSKDEKHGKTGLAHFFEHMMSGGTEENPTNQFERILDALGAENLNAFTNRDVTVYTQELPKEHLNTVARLEADRMVNLLIDEKAFRTELEVIKNEKRMRYENSPSGQLYLALFEIALKSTPYQHPVIGYDPDLNTLTREDALDFYKKYYGPNNATVIIVGDIQPGEAYRIIRNHFEPIQHRSTKTKVSFTREPQKKAKFLKVKLNAQTETLQLAYNIPNVRHPDNSALEVFEALLTNGANSRLRRSLIDSGIATDVSSGNFQHELPSIFLITAEISLKKRAATAQAIILKELKRLRTRKITHDELQRAKNLVEFRFLRSLSSSMGLARRIGSYELNAGGFENGFSIYEKIAEVTPEKVLEIATRYFRPENRTVLIGSPK